MGQRVHDHELHVLVFSTPRDRGNQQEGETNTAYYLKKKKKKLNGFNEIYSTPVLPLLRGTDVCQNETSSRLRGTTHKINRIQIQNKLQTHVHIHTQQRLSRQTDHGCPEKVYNKSSLSVPNLIPPGSSSAAVALLRPFVLFLFLLQSCRLHL